MRSWIEALAAAEAAGRGAVLVTVLRAEGSTPREAGAKMVVTAAAFEGTIGGGHLELEALAEARALLAAGDGPPAGGPRGPLVREYPLGAALGQCCGGRATLLFEPVLPPAWQVAVFGAGHVGRALVRLLADLPCEVRWLDPREAEFPAPRPPGVRCEVTDDPAGDVAGLPAGTDLVVLTHSHALDLEVVTAALRRPDLGFLGLIGSATKRRSFLARLEERGLGEAARARLTCPIGVGGVHGKRPAEIAIATAAQLLQRRGAAEAARERTAPAAGRVGAVPGRAGEEVTG